MTHILLEGQLGVAIAAFFGALLGEAVRPAIAEGMRMVVEKQRRVAAVDMATMERLEKIAEGTMLLIRKRNITPRELGALEGEIEEAALRFVSRRRVREFRRLVLHIGRAGKAKLVDMAFEDDVKRIAESWDSLKNACL